MAPWSAWTQTLQWALDFLGSQGDLSQAMAIIVLTLLVRAALMPLSLTSALRAQQRQEAMKRIQPEVQRLREAHAGDARALNRQVLALYRDNGIRAMDRLGLANLLTQGAFGIGLYQVLQGTAFSGRFLWIANLAKPDFWLTLLVGLLMAASMLLMPGATDNTTLMLVLLMVPVLVSVFAVAALPSAVGIYWATSNVASLAQGLLQRAWVARRRAATITA